ncbi:hypothetical protein A2W14_02090 [Candidatus Gottesmanbacteria bacterium RBG_16_37_8]|uniref:Uncharacterized protein n=1 Tax=Candidatus Gottesmanbacteria bacterium RBG_16_37_8 TaxID=1798371 RepID=A0A1F5YS52_9BACT|nr:MAG: hypothetical protein A2W14_02090 [Candidatus Gottesmanbacteria bacterium RBG_16_37_8]
MWYFTPSDQPDYIGIIFITMRNNITPGEKLQTELTLMSPVKRRDLESFIVNTVKIKLIKRFEEILENDGRSNLRQLLLVPVFSISELGKRITDNAPELTTLYYKELFAAFDEAGSKWNSG